MNQHITERAKKAFDAIACDGTDREWFTKFCTLFADMIVNDTLQICSEVEKKYHKWRLETDDFTAKTEFSAAELSASEIQNRIITKFKGK